VEEAQHYAVLSGAGPEAAAGLGRAYQQGGRRGFLRELISQLQEQEKAGRPLSYEIACLHSLLGDKDRAFDWLEKAYGERHPYLYNAKVDPYLDNLRGHPRFRDLLQRLNLSP
jgi:hypothetical protein